MLAILLCSQTVVIHGVNGYQKPSPPSEVSTWGVEPTPPDLLAWARQTLNQEEILAELEEVKRTGGLQLEDFIGEIEERIKRGG